MTFLESIKRAFGFSGEAYIDEDIQDEESGISVAPRTPYINPFKKEPESQKVEAPTEVSAKVTYSNLESSSSFSDHIPNEALQGIVDVMNSGLPDYVRKCLNEDAQKKYLCEVMGESFKKFADQIKQEAFRIVREQSQSAIAEWDMKNKDLESLASEQKTKCEELQLKYTESESQRKIITERARNLEAKVATCESEVEQYELENKSLLNKIKVMQVKTDDIQFFKDENARLLAELNKAKAQIVQSDNDAKASNDRISEIENLQEQIQYLNALNESLQAEKNSWENEKQALTTENENLKAEQTSLINDKKTLQANYESLSVEKDSFNEVIIQKDSIINRINSELADNFSIVENLRNENSQLREKIEELKASAIEQPSFDSSEINELKEKLRLASEQIDSLQEELTEANSNLEVVDKIQEQLDKVDEMKKRKDDKIENLTSSLFDRNNEIKSLKDEIENLKETIAVNQRVNTERLKEISNIYEEKLQKHTEDQKKKDNFDMTLMEDNDIISTPKVDKIEKAKQAQVESSVVEKIEILDSDIFETPIISEKATPKPQTINMLAEDDINAYVTKPHISAIETHSADWLRPSPPTPSLAEDVVVEEEEKKPETYQKPPKEDDDNLQMSLF